MRSLLWICLPLVGACAHEGSPPSRVPDAPDSAKLRAQCDGGPAAKCRRLAGAIITGQPGAPTDVHLARSQYTRDATACVELATAYQLARFPQVGTDLGSAAAYAERGRMWVSTRDEIIQLTPGGRWEHDREVLDGRQPHERCSSFVLRSETSTVPG